MSSVREIAQKAGVSITTVSRVLNNHPRVSEEARRRVLSAANKSRYQPTVGRRSTVNIALMYTGGLAVGSAFDAALMEGMSSGMEEFGYDLMVLDGQRARQPEETYSQLFMRKGVRGVILRSSMTSRTPAVEIADEGFPAVVLGDRFPHPSMTFVGTDSTAASSLAIQHLIDLGHRDIGVVTNIEDDCDHLDRIDGYHTTMEAAGLPHDASLVFRSPAHRVGGEAFINRFVSMPANARPTALYFVDPIAGLAALNRARTLGVRVPEDLSIVGFDDHEWRFLARPHLTAVCQDAVALGRSAFSVLNQLIERPDEPAQPESKPAWLEVHDSTGPPASRPTPD
ncbi:MAG: LacI family DNA-binding transcriptional regulator [Planctomycetota bacterium]